VVADGKTEPKYSISTTPKYDADAKTITFSFLKDGDEDTEILNNTKFSYTLTGGSAPVKDDDGNVVDANGGAEIKLDEALEPGKYTLKIDSVTGFEGIDWAPGTFTVEGEGTAPTQPAVPTNDWDAEATKTEDGTSVFPSSSAFTLNAAGDTITATIHDPRFVTLGISKYVWVWVKYPSSDGVSGAVAGRGAEYRVGSRILLADTDRADYYTLRIDLDDLGLPENDRETAARDFSVYYEAVDAPDKIYASSGRQSVSTGGTGSGGGGGCDAGFGIFGLLAAAGAVALLRKKG
jgi:hypothetical protein